MIQMNLAHDEQNVPKILFPFHRKKFPGLTATSNHIILRLFLNQWRFYLLCFFSNLCCPNAKLAFFHKFK